LYKLFVEEAGALNNENVDPGKSNDRLHNKENADDHERSFQSPELGDKLAHELSPEVSEKTIDNLDSLSHISTKKSRNTYKREWYKKLTPEQRKARNEHEKMAWSEGKRACKRRRSANRQQPHSIAMENPHYVPEILDPAKDGAKIGAEVSAADVTIPQFEWTPSDWTPIYIPPNSID